MDLAGAEDRFQNAPTNRISGYAPSRPSSLDFLCFQAWAATWSAYACRRSSFELFYLKTFAEHL